MHESPIEMTASNQVTLGCFEVGGRVVALDVAHVREVVRFQPVTPLPNSPRLIEGVIDLRGAVVPVVDLGRALGMEPMQVTPNSRVAVTVVDGLVVGLLVEAAVEVLQVNANSMEDPPALATHAGYQAARAVVRSTGADPIVVLSMEHLLENVYRSALPDREDVH
jgi:purine-binding chemotaxis protein CheW